MSWSRRGGSTVMPGAARSARRRRGSIIGAIERQAGVPVKYMEQVADAALAPRQVAELLQIRPRSPILLFQRTYFAANGEAVEHAVTYQACRRYPYRVVFSRPERRS